MKKLVSILIVVALISSMILVAMPINASMPLLPDYEPVDWQSGLAGSIEMPTVSTYEGYQEISIFTSTPPVGTKAYDWYLRAISRGTPTGTQPWMTLRAISGNVEVWTQDYLWFLPGDPRNNDPYNLMITDEMCQYLADEFNSVIYPTDTTYFGKPFDRNGTNTIFEQNGYPSYYWDWIATDNPQRVILKVLNIRDDNYYDPTYPYYVAGFYSSTYTVSYYNRNMIHIDAWRWWQRLGPEGHQWFPERPDLVVTRPYVYESTTAHEYQHNIHRDWQPAAETFMNEGCSMYAELLCGYGIEANYLNSYFATPDNSLTVWGDQGDINILADYGAAALWTVYLSDHYGGADLIRYYVQSGITGIDGINNALKAFKYKVKFDDVYHDWRLANLIRANFPGCHKYNYKSINLNDPAYIPVRIYEIGGLPVPWTKGTDFGNTFTILGYDTGISMIATYGTDYIALENWTRPGAGFIYFDGDDTSTLPPPHLWTLTSDGWYSGTGEDLANEAIGGTAYVDPSNPTLTIVTAYGLETYWDFGFVQVSTDSGKTWTSLENEYTTYDHDPGAHPDIVANLPGLTDYNLDWPDWTTMSFNLSAYAGQTVLIGFRYMTDWATTYEGWWINSATVSGTELTLAPLVPIPPEADFQVTIVQAFVIDGKTLYIPFDMWLKDTTETGISVGYAQKPNYAILVVTPITQKGLVDYEFQATTLKLPKCKGRMFD
jgi:hypothetical protein